MDITYMGEKERKFWLKAFEDSRPKLSNKDLGLGKAIVFGTGGSCDAESNSESLMKLFYQSNDPE